jgi:leucyl aminopeptidase
MALNSYEYKSRLDIVIASGEEPRGNLAAIFLPGVENPEPGLPQNDTGSIVLKQKPDGSNEAIVSLGKAGKITPDSYRQAGGSLARWIKKTGVVDVDIDMDMSQFNLSVSFDSITALLEGLWLGEYEFSHYKTDHKEAKSVSIRILGIPDKEQFAQHLERVHIITRAINTSRDWSFEPGNVLNPETLSSRVESMATATGISCTVLDAPSLEQMEAGGILAVGKGSQTPPCLIILEYAGNNSGSKKPPVVLVGKAITYDSGGYSIKDSENLRGMKYDKVGGIMVAMIVQAASELKLETPVVGIIAAAENMVSGGAYRPDDIIRTLSGKTVEIITTDAEGRLVLADALTYAQKNYKPSAMIDVATLTGGVVTALGKVRAGMMSNNDDLSRELFTFGEKNHERLWRLPLDDDYLEPTRGDDADLKNSGGRDGHPIMGGIFLKQFVDDATPWAHLDIAGVSDTNKETAYNPKGATGFGIRLLIDYLNNR